MLSMKLLVRFWMLMPVAVTVLLYALMKELSQLRLLKPMIVKLLSCKSGTSRRLITWHHV